MNGVTICAAGSILVFLANAIDYRSKGGRFLAPLPEGWARNGLCALSILIVLLAALSLARVAPPVYVTAAGTVLFVPWQLYAMYRRHIDPKF